MRRWAAIVVALVLVTAPLCAGSLEGVRMDDEITIGDKTLKLNGMGLRKKAFFKIYVAGLYLEQPSASASEIIDSQQVKKVVMHFTSGLAKKKKMDGAWDDGFEANSPSHMHALRERIETFKGFFGDMKDGDVVEYTMIPGEGTRVVLNGTEKGVIEGDDFAAALLRVWVGDKPPTRALKEGLLGE